MIAKLIVHGATREDAIARMSQALRELKIGPIRTTVALHARLMENPSFVKGGPDIHYLERLLNLS